MLDSVPFGEDGFSEGGVGSDGLVGSVSVPVAGINVTSFTASQFMQWIDLLPSSVAVGSLSMVNSVSQLGQLRLYPGFQLLCKQNMYAVHCLFPCRLVL